MMKTITNSIFFFLAMCCFTAVHAQERSVSGKVTSEDDGVGLPGVSVLIKGTNTGTVSDVDGNFRLTVPNDNTTIVVSFVGYESQTINVGSRSVVNVQMLTETEMLEELVVTAMGISREKEKLGYAVQELDSEDLRATGQSNLLNSMTGKVSGVQILSTGSSPGAAPSVIIRGMSSLNNNRPLYVIDGVPISNGNGGGTDYVSIDGTSDINPEEIASISVLKGAAATALYGSRAQNGAIIITTKDGSGAGDGFSIDFNASHSVEEITMLPDLYEDYDIGANGWRWQSGGSWGPRIVPGEEFGWAHNDWVDPTAIVPALQTNNAENFFDKGSTQRVGVGISGRSDKGNFYTGYTNLTQNGVVPNSEYTRHSFSLRGTSYLTERFSIGGSVSYNKSEAHNPRIGRTGFLAYLYYLPPWVDATGPHYDETGNRTYRNRWAGHPGRVLEENNVNKSIDRLIGNVNASYQINDILTASYRIGADLTNSIEDYYREKGLGIWSIDQRDLNSGIGEMWEDLRTRLDYNMDFILQGSKQINEDIELSGLLGWNYYSSDYSQRVATANTALIKGWRDMRNFDPVNVSYSTENTELIKHGTYTDWTFSYRGYLNLSATARYDVTSTLPKDNRAYLYWSTGLGFIVSDLVTLPSAFSFVKLRASYATVGNDTQPERVFETSEVQRGVFGLPRASVLDRLVDPNLQNEETQEWELGLDLLFFGRNVGLDVAYYNRSTVNQIIQAPVTSVTGYNTFVTNGGDIRNKGIEAVLSFNDIKVVGDLTWNAAINFTKNTNEVVEVSEQFGDEIVFEGGRFPSNVSIIAKEGQPFGVIKGLDYQRDANGDFIVGDNGRPLLTEDGVVLGNLNPDWMMGITNSLSFQGVALSATIDIRQGGDIVNGTRGALIYAGRDPITAERFYPDNEEVNATRIFPGTVQSTGEVNNIEHVLDRSYYRWLGGEVPVEVVEDGSWVRLRELSLSYRLPTTLIDKLPMSSLDITFSGRNLWIDTDYSGVDPEANSYGSSSNAIGGYDYFNLPSTKSYGLTLRATF